MLDSYLGTATGVHRLRGDALEPLGLAGERISAIHAFLLDGATAILAGSYEGGLYRSADADPGARSSSKAERLSVRREALDPHWTGQ